MSYYFYDNLLYTICLLRKLTHKSDGIASVNMHSLWVTEDRMMRSLTLVTRLLS